MAINTNSNSHTVLCDTIHWFVIVRIADMLLYSLAQEDIGKGRDVPQMCWFLAWVQMG